MPALFQNEQFGFAILVAGAVLMLVGTIWLIVRAFRVSLAWGAAVLFLPVIGVVGFVLKYFPKSRSPLAIMLLGLLIGGTPFVLNKFGNEQAAVPRIRETGGITVFTATNAADPNYVALSMNPDLEVVNISRADFTDETAEMLRPLAKLKVLELNDATISDNSLAIIATLPSLEVLKVARVKGITEAGMKNHIFGMKSLKEIDARQTAVTVEALREWRKGDPDRKTNPK